MALRTTVVLTLVGLGCARHRIDVPAPYVQNGVRIAVSDRASSTFGFLTIRGVIKNVDRVQRSVLVSFGLLDDSGKRIGTAMAHVEQLQPGQPRRFKAESLAPTEATRLVPDDIVSVPAAAQG